MTATVRSVDVRLNAIVSKYISEMRRAGRETDKAFAASQGNVRDLNRELGTASQRTKALDQSAKGMNATLGRSNTRLRVMGQQSKIAGDGLASVRTQVGALNGGGGDSIVTLGRNTQRSGRQLDSFSGRIGIIAQALAVLGPAAVPLTGVVVPALAGLANQLAFAVPSALTAIIAFQGVGDALKALDTARIEPTVDNLNAAQDAMQDLGPSGRDLVRHLYDLRGEWARTRAITQQGLFPGVESGLDALEGRIPQLEQILFQLSDSLGDALGSGARALSSTEWDDFFDFLQHEARPTLDDLAESVGNVAGGAAAMWMAFAPLEHDWNDWMVRGTESFEDWANRLESDQGFANFVAYVRETGPQVGETLMAWGDAFVQVTQAAAPLGGPVLQGLEAVADVISALADSDLGTPIFTGLAAMALMSRATKLWGTSAVASTRGFATGLALDVRGMMAVTTAQERASMSAGALAQKEQARRRTGLAAIGKTAAGAAGLALAMSGVADETSVSNTASLALMGTLAGPWGAAAGAAIGLTLDLAGANNGLEDAIKGATLAMESGSTEQMQASLQALDEQIASTEDKLGVERSWNPITMSKENLDAVVGGLNELVTGSKKKAEAARDETQAALAAADGQQRYAEATHVAGRVNRVTAAEIRGVTAAMEEQRQEALSAFDAVTKYGQALADARAAADKGQRGLDENTKKGRENRQALSELAAAWNNQGDAVRNNVGKYRSARKAFIDIATEMTGSRNRARELARALLELPKSIATRYAFFDKDARSAVARIMAELRTIPKSLRTDYYVNQINSISRPKALPGNPDGSGADGATVHGQRHPYGDKMVYAVAPGEEIVSNRHGGADRNRGELKAASKGAKLRIEGYAADGGTAGRDRVSLDDRLAIAQALQTIRDLSRQLADRVDKGKNKGELVTRGIERKVLALQLDAAQRDLRAAKNREVRETRQGIRTAVKALDILGDDNQDPTRAALAEFSKTVRDAGGKLGKDFGKLSDRAVKLSIRYNDAAAALDAATERRDSIRSAAVGAFNNDIFGGGLSDLGLQLNADTNDANDVAKALAIAAEHGLGGDLAAGLAGSGNVTLAKELANASPEVIAQLMAAYAGRTVAQQGLGDAAIGASGADQALAAATAAVDRLAGLMDGIEDRIGDSTYAGSLDGTAQRLKSKNTKIANRGRTH